MRHCANITSLDHLGFIGSCLLTFLFILRISLLVVMNYSDKPFGVVMKLILLEMNISLKGSEESSSSDFPVVH